MRYTSIQSAMSLTYVSTCKATSQSTLHCTVADAQLFHLQVAGLRSLRRALDNVLQQPVDAGIGTW